MFFLNRLATNQQPLDKLKDLLLEQNQTSQDQLDKINNKLDRILETSEQQQQQTERLFQRLESLEQQMKLQPTTDRDVSPLAITAPTTPITSPAPVPATIINQEDSPTTVPTIRDIPHPVDPATGRQVALPLNKSYIMAALQTIQGADNVNQEYLALFDATVTTIREMKFQYPERDFGNWRDVPQDIKLVIYDTAESKMRTTYGIAVDRAQGSWIVQSMLSSRWKERFRYARAAVKRRKKLAAMKTPLPVSKVNGVRTNSSSSSTSSSSPLPKSKTKTPLEVPGS
ncbi:hypothetical protein BCR42DRAFT_420465, partial [Absidia repens]